VNYEGQDYPFTGSPNYDTLAMTPIDDLTAEIVQKKSGKIIFRGRRVLARRSDNGFVFGCGCRRNSITD
jgi:hypothetical protein